MKHWRPILMAFLIAGVAGLAQAQDAPAKAGRGPALKEQPLKAVQAPNTYGTTFSSYYRMGASDFTGMRVPGDDEWTDVFYSTSTTVRRFPTVALGWFIGTPHLPSGAKVLTVNIQNCADSSGSISGAILACNNYGSGCTTLAPVNSAPGCGFDPIDVSSSGYVVDNRPVGNVLVIWLQLNNTDGSDSLAGASIEYQLQVSPAPAVATFPDVPTTDFGFQFVEALVKSGITGGCGGGLYCPDAPVTRRQMAIFIAKALGLQFN